MTSGRFRFSRSFVISSGAVLTVVGICSLTLLFLRPWPEPQTAGAVIPAQELGRSGEEAELRARAFNEPTARADRLTDFAAMGKEAGTVQQAALTPEAPLEPQAKGEQEAVTAAAPAAPADAEAAPSAPATTAAAPLPALKPGVQLTKAEVDEALKPLLDYDLSADDLKNLKEAFRLIQRDEFGAARPVIAKIGDTGAQKLALWYFYRSGAYDTAPEEIAAFRESNPLWPEQDELAIRVEEALFWREDNPKKILAYFKEHRPTSGSGKAALGGALIATGRKDEGNALIRTAANLIPREIDPLRVIDIVGLDKQADGGTHVLDTSEVGGVRVTGTESKGKGNKRVRLEVVDGPIPGTADHEPGA